LAKQAARASRSCHRCREKEADEKRDCRDDRNELLAFHESIRWVGMMGGYKIK